MKILSGNCSVPEDDFEFSNRVFILFDRFDYDQRRRAFKVRPQYSHYSEDLSDSPHLILIPEKMMMTIMIMTTMTNDNDDHLVLIMVMTIPRMKMTNEKHDHMIMLIIIIMNNNDLCDPLGLS